MTLWNSNISLPSVKVTHDKAVIWTLFFIKCRSFSGGFVSTTIDINLCWSALKSGANRVPYNARDVPPHLFDRCGAIWRPRSNHCPPQSLSWFIKFFLFPFMSIVSWPECSAMVFCCLYVTQIDFSRNRLSNTIQKANSWIYLQQCRTKYDGVQTRFEAETKMSQSLKIRRYN